MKMSFYINNRGKLVEKPIWRSWLVLLKADSSINLDIEKDDLLHISHYFNIYDGEDK